MDDPATIATSAGGCAHQRFLRERERSDSDV